jgi:hypothetical protein
MAVASDEGPLVRQGLDVDRARVEMPDRLRNAAQVEMVFDAQPQFARRRLKQKETDRAESGQLERGAEQLPERARGVLLFRDVHADVDQRRQLVRMRFQPVERGALAGDQLGHQRREVAHPEEGPVDAAVGRQFDIEEADALGPVVDRSHPDRIAVEGGRFESVGSLGAAPGKA